MQETHLLPITDVNFFQLPCYTLVYDFARINTFGGVAIYVHDSYFFERLDIELFYQNSTIFESILFNPIRSGLFQTVNDPGGGFKSPPLRSRKLLCQSLPYHTCEFYQVFLA